MNKLGCIILITLWSFSALAQDLSYCGEGYYIDLSTGYSPTAFGLELCGCDQSASKCELVHIIMRRTNGGLTELLDCPDISLTERWWREQRDLVDIFYADTCTELEESDTHHDRYIINTDHLNPGDTISILVCKTSAFDNNIIELSATPGQECSEFVCAPEMQCPIEFKLRLDLNCEYVLPDFRLGVDLLDTCVSPPVDVTSEYVIVQHPEAGTVVTEDLFVEIQVTTSQGEMIASCDVSVILAPNTPPVIDQPSSIADITYGDPLPSQEILTASDTAVDGSLSQIAVTASIDPTLEDVCTGYAVTYRWTAVDQCGLASETTMSFDVLPNPDGPQFASLPADIDTVFVGETLPILVDLVAVNPDGSITGISVESSIDDYIEDHCYGYEVTYRWVATDSCGDMSGLSKTFFVEPNGAPPVFLTSPTSIPDIYTSDTLPIPEILHATSIDGDTAGILVIHTIDPIIVDPCMAYEVVYRWTAVDSCGISATASQAFNVVPDTLTGSLLAGIEDLMIEISLECDQTAPIEIPIDLSDHLDKVITVIVTDGEWNVIDEYLYIGPVDYDFEMGVSHVIYDIADQCGRSFRDTINVNAEDISAPLFICPDDQQVILVDLASCSTPATWALPMAFDNCDEVDVLQTGGPQVGASLGVGVYEITYEATDASDNASSCTFDLIVSPISNTSLDCPLITLELDSLCQALLTKEDITGSELLVCAPTLELEVIIGLDTLRGDSLDLGPYYGAEITYTLCDDVASICCENSIVLSDRISPILTCADTISTSCLTDLDDYRPTVALECGPITWQIRDLEYLPVCNDPLIQGHLLREFVAIDHVGNASLPCIQAFDVQYANVDTLLANDRLSFPGDTIISCEYDLSEITETLYGSPMLDNIVIHSMSDNLCGITADYEDELYLAQGCTKIIKRHWTVREELCGYGTRDIKDIQFIRLIDTIGPILSGHEDVIQAFTLLNDCHALFEIPRWSIVDNCQDSTSLHYVILYNNESYFAGDTLELPPGLNALTIRSHDGCSNFSIDSAYVEVIDNVQPVAACLERATISITSGTVSYPYAALDIGSYDNCGIEIIEIARDEVSCSEQDTVFGPAIFFCCNDIGRSVKVLLRTVDAMGNENVCWGIVDVQEKIMPTVICPPDLVLDCGLAYGRSSDDSDPYGHVFGSVKSEQNRHPISIDSVYILQSSGALIDGLAYDNCDGDVDLEVITEEAIDQCGIGTIRRFFTAIDQAGNRSETCTQVIEIRGNPSLDTTAIIWPELDILINECKLSNSISPDALGRPTITDQPCNLTGISYEDTYIDFSESVTGSCSKIIRTWTVINWCDSDPLLKAISRSQVIKVVDNDNPVILACSDTPIHYSDILEGCTEVPITLNKAASDNCTSDEQQEWLVSIDFYTDGSLNMNESLTADSSGAILNVDMPIGRHKVLWTVVDKCGNRATCEEVIIVENAKAPTLIATGVSTTLSEHGDVSIWVEDLLIKTEHPCELVINTAISRDGENFEEARSQLTFTCADVGMNVVKVYAAITLSDNTAYHDYVTVLVDIEDSNCDNTTSEEIIKGEVSGLVFTSDGRMVPGVTLGLKEVFSEEIMEEGYSDNQGYFQLGPIPAQGTYYVTSSLEDNILEGITTLDIVLMQRHILGEGPFDNPYSIIAGDVNRDQKVSVSDILDVRRAILHLPSTFAQHQAWRFVDADYNFTYMDAPLDDNPSEIALVYYNDPIANLVAMKAGDVNNSAEIIKTDKADNRSIITLQTEEELFQKGDDVVIELNTPKNIETFGYQMSILVDPGKLEPNEVTTVDGMDIAHHVGEDGVLRISSMSGAATKIDSKTPIIIIKCKARSMGRISESISLERSEMSSELYNSNLDIEKLDLTFFDDQTVREISESFPNPFREITNIDVNLSQKEEAYMRVYDIRGRVALARRLALPSGRSQITIDRQDLKESGVYYVHITTENETHTQSLVILD